MSEHKVLLELESAWVSSRERLLVEMKDLPPGLKCGDVLEWDIEEPFLGSEELPPDLLNGRWMMIDIVWRNEGGEWMKVFRIMRDEGEGYE